MAEPIQSGTSVPALVLARFGIAISGAHARFEEDGWSLQGVSDVVCGTCESAEPFIIYRKPYTTTQGDYRYWAIVCLECETVSALSDFDKDGKKLLRKWDSRSDAEEIDAATDIEDDAGQEVGDDGLPSSRSTAPVQRDAPPITVDEEEADPGPVRPAGGQEAAQGVALRLALRAARLESEASKGSVRVVDVGSAVRIEESPRQTSFRVASPNIDLSEQPGGELFLATGSDTERRFQVASVRHASRSETVVVAAGEVDEVSGLHLYSKVDPSLIPEAFVRFLEKLPSAGLAAAMQGGGRLTSGSPVHAPDLNTEQRAAVGAILAPGVAAIWGPPGTGKTRVIGAAVARLVTAGKTVALVSNTNVAVDQALLHVSREVGPVDAGQIVRVGNPSLAEVADHPTLPLAKAVQQCHNGLMSEMEVLRSELDRLRSHTTPEENRRRIELGRDRTLDDLERLLQRRRDRERIETVTTDLRRATEQAASFEADREACGVAYDNARRAKEMLAEYDHLLDADRTAAAAADDIARLESEVTKCGLQLDAVRRGPVLKRRRASRAVESRLAQLEAERQQHSSVLSAAELRLSGAAANGVTPASLREAREAEREARRAWEESKSELEAKTVKAVELRSELDRLAAIQAPSREDLEVIELIESEGSPEALLESVKQARVADERRARRVRELTTKIEGIQRRLADLTQAMVREAPVIGTTLAQLTLHQALSHRSFDYVVIDEASAVLPPYAFAALAKAEVGAAVVGDAEQNAPISRTAPAKVPPEVRPWLMADPLTMLGVGDAGATGIADGCVALRAQYRFGDVTMQIANAVAYGGLLRHGRNLAPRPSADPELVIVDTTSLGASARAERGAGGKGRWWAAGTAVAFALAQAHNPEDVGVITPYRAQAQLTRSRMLDAGAEVQVGTAHSFQGREFPTVILDLVEDGTGQSWVARAGHSKGPWERAGVRVFNVGVTRNANRLYIVGSLGTINSAQRGPLLEVRKALARKDVAIWDARELIEGPADLSTDGARDLPALVELAEQPSDPPVLLDDETFYSHFVADVEAALQRVVIFSPFISARRAQDLLPVLSAAANRGVRVTALTKASHELADPSLLARLSRVGVVVRERQGMHEKVVIVDDSVSYIGSLNVLSNTGRTGEVMLRFAGRETTARLTQFMRSAARR